MAYRIETTFRNYLTGEVRRQVLPKVYKTRRGAEKAADGMMYVHKPDGKTAASKLEARIIG